MGRVGDFKVIHNAEHNKTVVLAGSERKESWRQRNSFPIGSTEPQNNVEL